MIYFCKKCGTRCVAPGACDACTPGGVSIWAEPAAKTDPKRESDSKNAPVEKVTEPSRKRS